MHVIKLLERRFQNTGGRIIAVALFSVDNLVAAGNGF